MSRTAKIQNKDGTSSTHSWLILPKGAVYCRIAGEDRLNIHARELRRSVIARDGTACWICGIEVPADQQSLDHIIPLSLGGESYIDNLKIAHTKCNGFRSSKAHLTPEELVKHMQSRTREFKDSKRRDYAEMLYKELARMYIDSLYVNQAFRELYGDEFGLAPKIEE